MEALMATDYLARVELRADAAPSEHEAVSALMKTCGFERWLVGAESEQPFVLPQDTYLGRANLNRQQAFDMLKDALVVEFPSSSYSLVLAELSGLLFEGLAPVG
jgi:hypothetical protein